ncbi:PAS domain S-box-containing protein [Formivibrio citricus]|uniref:histidine kinase n=1 Tax=Formivibrio citricus TaxID=83765 RepID=A0A1I4WJY9_9NEIS|nr:PAS domain-containing hybrid sensor histidine kinase/response regulator [Formivibrio citricus]SFN13536.1 PAS domain S-box-containing protein [Formivibrio citricus]
MNPLAELLLNACAETVIAVDAETLTIVSANKQVENMLGYAVNDLIGRPIADIEVGLQDMFFWEEVKNGTRQERHAVEGEYRHRSGNLIAVQKTVRLVDMQGKQVFVLSVHDITATKQMEDETARTASLLAATLESTMDGILVTGLSGGVRHFNHRFAEMWRLPMALFGEEDEPRVLKHLLHQLADPTHFREWFENMLSRPQAEGSIECRLLDGRVYSLSSKPQRLRERPIGRVFSFHDITSLKATEAQLIAARDAAQAASRAKSEFLSHMSHELRTPLNAILGFGKVLEDELEGPPHTIAEHIGKAGKHLLDLINEVLDLASIEAGKMRIQPTAVDLASLIEDCASLVEPLARSRQISLHVTPLEHNRFLVRADARRLKQMALNLLSNAIKYNRDNGRVDITVTAQGDNNWRLNVIDTGIGIDESDLSRLFLPFNRFGERQLEAEGAGIGLAFTRKLARLMDGNVGVESQVGIGSRFWIDLPCAQFEHAAEPVMQKTPLLAGAVSPGKSATLLYIEDDPLSQKLLSTVLSRKRPFYRILTADSGNDGVALARETRPDVILLDQQLPDGMGADFFQALKNQPETQNTPVIALSGNAQPEEVRTVLESGYVAYLVKPLQIDTALTAIDNAIPEKKS